MILRSEQLSNGKWMVWVSTGSSTTEVLYFKDNPTEQEVEGILAQKAALNAWPENTSFRVFMPHDSKGKLIDVPGGLTLITQIYNSDLTRETTPQGTYVYVDYIFDNDRALILDVGGQIIPRA